VEIAAFVAAGYWAVYTFVYQTRIAPLFQPAHEIVSINAQRLATTPANYLERVDVVIHNDGTVDVDNAAMAIAVFAAQAEKNVALQSSTSSAEVAYRQIPDGSWKPVGGYAKLLDGAIHGADQHFRLLPGDSATVERVIVVPRSYQVLYVRFQTVFGRFPIRPRVNVRLAAVNGAVTLKGEHISIETESFFGV
jgi:hypothetical protein